jgi:glycosyltransferase involved in cell wall biosynthesis
MLSQAWLYGLPPWPRGSSVHATTPLAPGRLAMADRSRPLIVTVHDTVPWSHPETLTPRGVSWHRTMIGRAARLADYLVVPTQVVADELAAIYPVAADRIRVVGHGVTALPIIENAASRAAALRLPDRYVLSLATVEPRKGLDVLIKAMPGVPADLVIVGQAGWGDVDLGKWAQDAGLDASRVHTLGRISDADLAVVLDRAAVLAVPSRAEGFGLPVLEGMAAGVPVVMSDAPALVEVAGGATVIVPREDIGGLTDALNAVLGDDARATELRVNGRTRAARFSWAAAADALWSLHLSLVPRD